MPTTVPQIAEILTLLPSDVRAVRVFEILTIYWQGGTRTGTTRMADGLMTSLRLRHSASM